jgi:hypothetical protein
MWLGAYTMLLSDSILNNTTQPHKGKNDAKYG